MGVIGLNTIGLDGNVVVKKGGGSGGGGNSGGGGSTKPKWTGHADAEGLRAIGWTDEDIAYYQENGVNWNEEDDEWHKVSEDNKALYGVLTASNISTYKDRIVYLPKIDTSGVTSMKEKFKDCSIMVAIPKLDTSSVTDMSYMFSSCHSLTTIPPLDTSNVINMNGLFANCYLLTSIQSMNTSNVKYMGSTFMSCYSLTSIPNLDTSNANGMISIFAGCIALTTTLMLDMSNAKEYTTSAFSNCFSLTNVYIKGVDNYIELKHVPFMTKASLLYTIDNEASTKATQIMLHKYTYRRLASDPDIVEALANHPNISLASA